MAYRGERATGRTYSEDTQRAQERDPRDQAGDAPGVDERAPADALVSEAPADAALASLAPAYPPLWPPDERPERPIPSSDLAAHGDATAAPSAFTEAETVRIPIPTTISEAETARIPAPGALSEVDTARMPTPTARPSAGPLPTPAVAAIPGAPASPASAALAPLPAGAPISGDGSAPIPGRGLADLPTARIPTAGPRLSPAAPTPPPPVEPIWNAPTAPLAPLQPFTSPPVAEPAPRPSRPPLLEPTPELAPAHTGWWGATGAPSWAAPAHVASPSTPLTPASPLVPMWSAAPALPATAPSVAPPPTGPAASPPHRPTGAPVVAAPTPGMTPDAPPDAPGTPRRTGALGLRLAVIALLVALVLAVAGVGVAYGYGVSQSGAPQRTISAYCDALRQANYTAAYDLLAPAAQMLIPRQQYVTDGQARDAFYGRVSACQTQFLGADGRFIFWRQPTVVMYALTLQRAGGASAHSTPVSATGHVALAPDGADWRISTVDASLLGVDLDPLTVASDFCQALIARDYARAYGDLSSPFQHEQGSASGFAKAFGAVGKVTTCADTLSTYSVSASDQSAKLALTLGVRGALPGGSATSVAFTIPATLTLVRTAQGWRVDSLTLGAPTPQS